MKKGPTIFLQIVIVLIGIIALVIMVRLPLAEGRAVNLDLFSIYADPFLIYGYLSSIAFFVPLYQAFKLLGYIGQSKAFSPNSIKTLRTIRHCAIILSILIAMSALYIRIFHAIGDDPAGFIAICIVTIFISIIIATKTVVFEQILQSGANLKSEKDLTV